MSKGNQNKFLTVYFSVLGAGVLGLGYLAWSASSSADTAQEEYKKAVSQLDALENAPLSRTEENAKKKKDDVEKYVNQVKALNTELLKYQSKIDASASSESFQKKLSEAKNEVVKNAEAKQVTLDKSFDLGMGKYLSEFPVAGSAPRLSAQLDAIVNLTNLALDSGITEINALTRPEQPYEQEASETPKADPKAKKTPPPKSQKAPATAPKAGPAELVEESKVMERQPVAITVTGKNLSVIRFLELLANPAVEQAPYFYTIRTLHLENEMKDGPPKTVTVTAEEVQPDPNNKESVFVRDAKYLLGNEKVKMRLDLDVVRFVEEPEAAAPGKAPAKTTAAVR